MSADQVVRRKTKEEIAVAYKSEPWWYDLRGFFILTFAYNSTLGAQLRFFAPNIAQRHLEVACGTGTLLQWFLRWRRFKKMPEAHIVGVDYAESMLAGARHRFRNDPRVELRHADAAAMPFADDSFESANVANAVHCFPDVDGALRDIFRVLAPGGRLAVNVLLYPRGPWPLKGIADRINRWGIRKGILYNPYEQSDIRARIIKSGFHIERENVAGNCYDVLATKPDRLTT